MATSFEEIEGEHPLFYHNIDTGDAKPIYSRARPLPRAREEWLNEELRRMEKAGIIKETQSPWASPIVITTKKSDTPGEFVPRLCVDYRRLNDITKKDRQPLPNIDHVLATLGNGPKYFTSLDLFAGYHQIGMTPEAIERSAFITPRSTYVYLRMPFGLCNALATFQRAMNEIFGDIINRWMMVYVDDVIIYNRTFTEHLQAI